MQWEAKVRNTSAHCCLCPKSPGFVRFHKQRESPLETLGIHAEIGMETETERLHVCVYINGIIQVLSIPSVDV